MITINCVYFLSHAPVGIDLYIWHHGQLRVEENLEINSPCGSCQFSLYGLKKAKFYTLEFAEIKDTLLK